MSNSEMQPQRVTSSGPKPPSIMGDPAGSMSATLTWNGSGVSISFPANEIYSDNTSQSWTWNGASRNEGASTRSDSFTSSNATGNSLTVVQNRPSGAVTFSATGIARSATGATLNKQP